MGGCCRSGKRSMKEEVIVPVNQGKCFSVATVASCCLSGGVLSNTFLHRCTKKTSKILCTKVISLTSLT